MVKKNREVSMLFLVRTTRAIMTLFKLREEERKLKGVGWYTGKLSKTFLHILESMLVFGYLFMILFLFSLRLEIENEITYPLLNLTY